MCPCGQVVRRLICNQKIPSSNLGGGFLALAQLAERWTVIVFLWLSTGRWFDSSKREFFIM